MMNPGLLDQLRKQDPVLWDKFYDEMLEESDYYRSSRNLATAPRTAWLQHCLQEAVREREWQYRLGNVYNRGWALIQIGGHDLTRFYAATEAEALCNAYLEAVRG